MNQEAFLVKLADVLEVSKDELHENSTLNTNTWDSMAILAVIALIDEEFDVTVPTQELTDCATVGDLLELVRRNLV